MDKNYVTIIDNTGRNIIGVLSSESKSDIEILNPVMITVQPANGQFQVQLIPLFLGEFIQPTEDGKRDFVYSYSKSNVAVGKAFTIDPRITTQYDRIVAAANAQKQAEAPKDAKPEVIKLFEE